MESQHLPSDFLPVAIQFIVAAGFVVVVMLATHLLGPQRKTKVKGETFECGISFNRVSQVVKVNGVCPFTIFKSKQLNHKVGIIRAWWTIENGPISFVSIISYITVSISECSGQGKWQPDTFLRKINRFKSKLRNNRILIGLAAGNCKQNDHKKSEENPFHLWKKRPCKFTKNRTTIGFCTSFLFYYEENMIRGVEFQPNEAISFKMMTNILTMLH